MTDRNKKTELEELIDKVRKLKDEAKDGVGVIAFEHAEYDLQSRYKTLTGNYYHPSRKSNVDEEIDFQLAYGRKQAG